jgi:deoxyribodipyrimidine photolyase-related protein
MNLLLLPHQLFDSKHFPKDKEIKKIILYEHPQYFTKYNFNKKKLVLHRASMKSYSDTLSKNYQVEYVEYNQKLPTKDFIMFDPVDNLKPKIKAKEVIETPNFLLTKEDYLKYRKKTDKFMFQAFYMFGKKIVDIIPTVKSQDKQNREKIPKNVPIPKIPSNKNSNDNKYVKEAQEYVTKNFPKNYGSVNDFQFPISHKVTKSWLDKFLSQKLNKFGPYQDFIIKDEDYLFHSCLSSSINIGLINPLEIIEILKGKKDSYPLNSYEGYIRQLYWREYQRYTFIYCDFNCNYFGNQKKLNKDWYEGTLGIEPVDDAIKRGFETGYLHHINRLMVVGNYMNLSEISPKEGLKWFMEFSVDSYEWVMYQNVLDMVFFVTGGKTMRKPYASSSNYVINMSTYKKGDWSKKWDEKYVDFQKKNLEKLWKFRYSFPMLKKLKEN